MSNSADEIVTSVSAITQLALLSILETRVVLESQHCASFRLRGMLIQRSKEFFRNVRNDSTHVRELNSGLVEAKLHSAPWKEIGVLDAIESLLLNSGYDASIIQ